MYKRRKSNVIQIGNVKIGGDNPISVQTMCNTDTRDVEKTVSQIKEMEEKGAELVRLAIVNKDAASAVKEIIKKVNVPLIADIHFDYRLAIQCIENGISALRINPGNIGKAENVKTICKLAKQNNVPIRIGINGGSLDKKYSDMDIPLSEKMVASAMEHIKILEDNDFDKIKISLKSSDVMTTIEAYRLMAQKVPYPLHLGVTEAGTSYGGLIKSSVGLGTLLAEGIGDTIRVSLTENPVEEVKAGYEILKSLGLRKKGINFISCPTCGRCTIDLINLAKKTEAKFQNYDKNITIAVMGCPVNGPGEAKHADYGVCGANGQGFVFKKGVIVKKTSEDKLLDELSNLIKQDEKQK